MKKLYALIVLYLVCGSLNAQEQTIYEDFVLEVSKSIPSIMIDGNLDEPIWNEAVITSDFLNQYPKDTGFAEAQTQAWITYDDEFIYIGAINYQKKEDLVIKSLKRDNSSYHWDSEAFTVILDPFNQQTTGFIFGVNAAGARVDGVISIENSRTRPDFNWDNTWESSVKVHDEYWTVEIAIPFKTINYYPGNTKWGINFARNDMKRNVYSTWSHVPQEFPIIDIGHLGTMQLEESPKERKQRMVLQPYVLSSAQQNFEDNEDLDPSFDVGLDAKIPLGSTFKLDLTLNPDFSTIDVDQQVTNLSRFSIFFPEKRTFFLENSDLFSSFGSWGVKPFFSRKIGLNDGELIPILFGARTSGNINESLRVGAMNVQTRGTDDINANNYTVAAVQQGVFGRSSVKALVTNRSAISTNGNSVEDFNRTIGTEFHFTSESGQLNGSARAHWSQTEERLQNATYLGATMMYNDGKKFVGINAERLDDNFINELGFSNRLFQYDAERDSLVRVGFTYLNPWIGFTHRPESDWVNFHEFSTWTVLSWENDGQLIDRLSTLNYFLSTLNAGALDVSLRNTSVRLLFPTDLIGGEEFLPAKKYHFNTLSVNYTSDQRGLVGGSLEMSYGGFYGGTRLQFGGEVTARTQPWGNYGLAYVGNRVELPGNYGKATLHLVGPKVEFSFSSALNFTTFMQYNTQSDNFNVNSRLQWRFAAMSDIYLVYNDNYGTENFGVKNRGIVFKMNYWIN